MFDEFPELSVEELTGARKGAMKIGPFGSQLRKEEMVEHGVKVYGQENVIAEDWTVGERRISHSKFRALGSCELEPGDLVVSMMGTVGKCAVFPADAERGIMDSHLLRIQPNLALVDRGYFALALQAENVVGRQVKAMSHGSIMAGLSSKIVKGFKIPLPPLGEQPKIVEILRAIDTAIHETEEIIAKLKAVKQGLLHDLLTCGIDANGELRPSQAEAPHLYKLSKLGWVPREWDIVRIGEDTDIEHGFAFPGHQFTDKEVGPALLVPGNFHREGGLYFTTENTKYFSGKYLQEYMLSRGDVLVVMTDLSPMTLILGRTVVLTEEFNVLHNQRIGKFRFRKDGLWDPKFFAETLSQDAVRMKVIAEATGTTVRHTSPDRIKSCYVARPKLEEQQLASQRINVVESKRKLEEAKLLKLKQTKTGLMDDLLTGRVRVTPLLNTNNEQGAI